MSDVFLVKVLPAQRGDCLWIEYGPADSPHHVLIDAGITRTGRETLRRLMVDAPKPLTFDLFIITHIDLDHIQGAIALLKDLPEDVTFHEIWFNGWRQLQPLEDFGVAEGIELGEILKRNHAAAWNKWTEGKAIEVATSGDVRSHSLPGGMIVTPLSPVRDQLVTLRDKWKEVLEEFGAAQEAELAGEHPGLDPELAGLEQMGAIDVPGLAEAKFKEDRTVPNGSSIAVQLEFAGKRALMLADAYPSVIAKSLARLSEGERHRVDLVKLPHHGSRNNTHRALVKALAAPMWVFSSNGAGNTKHPHLEAVARVLHGAEGPKTLVFNYKTAFNDIWDDNQLKAEHDYAVVYGDGESPVIVRL